MGGRSRFRAVLVISLQVLIVNTPVAALTIQVCQNKDCCKRYKTQSMNLVHTFYNLLPPSSDRTIHVESTGCLSQCEKGPNIAFKQDNSNKEEPTIYNGISDHFSAAAVLPIDPPPTLLAAVSVMEKAEKATQVEKKMQCLNSVLEKLKATDQLGQSAAMAYAHCLRAQVHLECNNDYQLAKQDIQQATAITTTAGYLLPTCAWTTLADAEEKSGNVAGAMEAWRQLANAYPSYATKVAKEVKRLQLMG